MSSANGPRTEPRLATIASQTGLWSSGTWSRSVTAGIRMLILAVPCRLAAGAGAARGLGHGEAEAAALAGRALDPDPPALELDQAANQRQAEPGALLPSQPRALELAEGLEDQILVRARDADPRVRDHD